MTVDFNNEETRRQFCQVIAICLANTRDDGMINSDRTMQHIADYMSNPPPEDLFKEAVAHYIAMTDLIKVYRKWYAGAAMAPLNNLPA